MTKSKGLRPLIKRRVVDGVEYFTCRKCEKEKPRKQMRKRYGIRAKSGYGVDAVCNDCALERERTVYGARRKDNDKRRWQREREHDNAADAKYEEWIKGKTLLVTARSLQPVAKQLVAQAGTYTEAEDWSGVAERIIRRIVNLNQIHVEVGTAEKIARAAGVDMADVVPVAGIEGWNKAGDICCQRCGTFFHKHKSKGLCRLCYHRDYYGCNVVDNGMRKGWANKHLACRWCGTTERPHYALGFCRACYHDNENGKPPPEERVRECEWCGQWFRWNNPKNLLCSGRCKSAKYRAARKAKTW